MMAMMGGNWMKAKKKLRLLLGGIILSSLGGVALLTWNTLAPPPERNIPEQEAAIAADLQLNRVKYTETREGKKEWELEATSVRYFKDENTVLLEKVKATFFREDQETYVLVGERGKLNTQTKAIEVFDGVIIDSSDGYRMQTRSLKYEPEKRELSTADPVELKGPQLRVEGTGLIVDLHSQRLKVLSRVTTTFSQTAKKSSGTSL